jgi:hypothetical protein
MKHDTSLPSSCSVRLMDARFGQCRAIVGYLNGRCADAVICALPVAPSTIGRNGKPIEYSWCPAHKGVYISEDRPRPMRIPASICAA